MKNIILFPFRLIGILFWLFVLVPVSWGMRFKKQTYLILAVVSIVATGFSTSAFIDFSLILLFCVFLWMSVMCTIKL